MKNKKILSVFCIVILLILAILMISKYLIKADETWITDHEFLYDKAIKYLENEELEQVKDGNLQDFMIFSDYETFGISMKGNQKYAYMWILMESYYMKDNKPEMYQGSSIAYRFTFENDEVVSYEIPKDGSYYTVSLKEMLPDSIEYQVMNYKPNHTEINKQIEDYYSNKISNIDTKNYSKDLKIAYSDEIDKENSSFIYSNTKDNNYNPKNYIIENKTILKSMPEIDFTKFNELEDKFYCLKITDYGIYKEYSKNYNLRELSSSDFDNIFVEIIIRKSADNSIKSLDMIEGYEYIANEENNRFPVTVGGLLDVTEDFKYPCIIAYFPNYLNRHYNDFYFNVIVQNENIVVSKEKALEIAKKYLSNLSYKGVSDFSYMDYLRIENVCSNDFINNEDKEHPIENTNKKHLVWSIAAYSNEDPCTWANVYVDVKTGKIIGGKLNYATD